MNPRSTTRRGLDKYNQLIHLLLDDLQEMLDGFVREDERQWVLTISEKVADYLQAQFDLEESGGYLTEVLEEFPNWHPQLEHLQQEHHHLHRQFNEIRELLAASKPDSLMTVHARRHLSDWITTYRNHQLKENELLQAAYTLDVGVGE